MQLAELAADEGGLPVPGSVLTAAGLAAPLLDPEQALLIDLTRAEVS